MNREFPFISRQLSFYYKLIKTHKHLLPEKFSYAILKLHSPTCQGDDIMRKILRIAIIIAGLFFIWNGIFVSVYSNFNIGIIPVFALGIMLTAYGFLFNKLKGKKIIHTFVSLVVAVLLVFGSFLAFCGSNDNVTYEEDVLIVLGCGIRGERVTAGLGKRLDKALQYYGENPDVIIIVSGGQGPQEDIPEALAMQRYLTERGVPESQIIMEDKSTSTITNFRNSHEIMKEKGLPDDSVAFVTNAYHVYRGTYYAREEGLDVTHLGTDIVWYTVPMNYFREMLAVMKMWVFD